MNNLLQLDLHTIPPITEPGPYRYNCTSISFHNAGDSTVILNRHFEIPPSGSVQFGVSDERNSILSVKIDVIFSGGTTNKLQGMLLIPADKKFANYVQK